MTLAKRLTAIEGDNLTRGRRSSCGCGSPRVRLLGHVCRWLLDQPDESYPLIRMPRQVVDAVRARHKGVKDERLRDQFYQVQKTYSSSTTCRKSRRCGRLWRRNRSICTASSSLRTCGCS